MQDYFSLKKKKSLFLFIKVYCIKKKEHFKEIRIKKQKQKQKKKKQKKTGS